MPARAESNFLTFALFFTAVGFILHFTWEYFQCSPFFRHGSVQPNIRAMTLVTFGDIGIMWFAYGCAALATRSAVWYKRTWSASALFSFIIPAAVVVSIVEFLALQDGRWSYTAVNPTLPRLGISLLPVFQMGLINPAAIYFSKLFLNGFGKRQTKPKGAFMNAKLLSALTAFLLLGFVATTAYSEDAKPAAESHDQHHPDAKAATPKTDTGAMGDQGGMMGKMDMGQMHSMMQECMSMHKDGKMCDHDMMEKCEKQMGKGECQKMMKQAKAKTTKEKGKTK